MGDKTKIEWTDATWNPIRGCTRVSEGCRNCYAEVMAARFSDPGQWGHGLAKRVTLADGSTDHRWTGEMRLIDSALDLPLRWTRPRRIFVNSTSDLFHEAVPDDWIDRVFAVMALTPQHTFQVLTKRPERAQRYFTHDDGFGRWGHIEHRARQMLDRLGRPQPRNQTLAHYGGRNFPHVWLGTSVEDQASADARIPHLLATPASVRFISAEPLLGPVNLLVTDYRGHDISALRGIACDPTDSDGPDEYYRTGKLDWVIVGGESGPGARPMQPDWARSLRDQCAAAGVAFFMKQMDKKTPIPDDLLIRQFPGDAS
jgi:protein gp37